MALQLCGRPALMMRFFLAWRLPLLLSVPVPVNSFVPRKVTTTRRLRSPSSLTPLVYAQYTDATPRLLASTSSSSTESTESDKDTVENIVTQSGSRVTLIGTAHLSEASNEQVKRIIQENKPDVVMVEMDKSRIQRIGYETLEDIGLPVITADDIVPPDDGKKVETPLWKLPQAFALELLLGVITSLSRKLLTNMYNEASEGMKSEQGPGGEFKVAIEAAKANGAERVVLGDRKSTITIRRTAELAFESGDPWGVLEKFNTVNAEEMQKAEDKVKQDLKGTLPDDDKDALMKAMIENLKTDSTSRERLLDRLAQEVPEFSQAFLTDRDYIMAESIRRELDKGARHVVGVVGLAHVLGIADNLRDT